VRSDVLCVGFALIHGNGRRHSADLSLKKLVVLHLTILLGSVKVLVAVALSATMHSAHRRATRDHVQLVCRVTSVLIMLPVSRRKFGYLCIQEILRNFLGVHMSDRAEVPASVRARSSVHARLHLRVGLSCVRA